MRFILDNTNDIIQNHLYRGVFYEEIFLKIMKEYCPDGSVILDLGANIGNHTVYFSKYFNAKTIYPMEPIPRFYKMLLCNVALNYCHNVNLDYIGLAIGDRECLGYPYTVYGEDNLGSTMLSPTNIVAKNPDDQKLLMDPVQIVSGDSLFKDIHVDFIKIDVETMEMVVLAGLKETIAKCRPNMFIEINDNNQNEFNEWLNNNDYEIKWRSPVMPPNSNYIISSK